MKEISRLLKPNDVLLLNGTVAQKNQIFSLLGHIPEAIAHNHPQVAMMIIHFPQS